MMNKVKYFHTIISEYEKIDENEALHKISEIEKSILLDPKQNRIPLVQTITNLAHAYVFKKDVKAALDLIDRGGNFLTKLPHAIENSMYFIITYGLKISMFLGMNDIQRVKENLLKCKEVCDKSDENGEGLNPKDRLYRHYYDYYSHASINNFKKSILNYAGWFKRQHESQRADFLIDELITISKMCMKNQAHRQNEYLLRVMRAILNQSETTKVSNHEVLELKLCLEEVLHMSTLFMDMRSILPENIDRLGKYSNYFVSFEFPGVSDSGDPLFDGSTKNPAKIGEVVFKLMEKVAAAQKLFKIARPKLMKGEFDHFSKKIEIALDMIKMLY